MLIFLIVVLGLTLLLFKVFNIGDFFSPWSITVAVWLGIFLLFLLFGDNLYPLQERLYTCVGIWIPILLATSLLTYYAIPPTTENANAEIEINNKIYSFFFVISVVCSPIYLYQMLKIVMMFSSEDIVSNIRMLANYGEDNATTSILKYINAINQVLFIVELWRYPKGGKVKFFIILMANLLCSVAVMSKTPLFLMFFTTLFILYEKKKISIGKIAMYVVIIIFLFYGINELRTPSDVKSETTLLDFFCMYIMSPSVAFEWAQEKLTDQYGTFSFAFFYAFASKLGLGHFYVQQQLQEFVYVPISTNVYTVFQPYYEDFGYSGIAFFASVWGVFTGLIYRLCKNGAKFAKCIYTYLTVPLVMQFYQESLMVNLSILIQFSVLFWLLVQQKYSIKFFNRENVEK